jgi:hypothetical protein
MTEDVDLNRVRYQQLVCIELYTITGNRLLRNLISLDEDFNEG